MARLRAEEAGLKEAEGFRPNLWAGLAFAVGGMVAVMLGARFLVITSYSIHYTKLYDAVRRS